MSNALINITKKDGVIKIEALSEIAIKELTEFKFIIKALYDGPLLQISQQHSTQMSKEIKELSEAFDNIELIELKEEVIKNQINLIEWIIKDQAIPEKVRLALELIISGFSQLLINAIEV